MKKHLRKQVLFQLNSAAPSEIALQATKFLQSEIGLRPAVCRI